MNDDYIFDEEVDEKAAEEKARREAQGEKKPEVDNRDSRFFYGEDSDRSKSSFTANNASDAGLNNNQKDDGQNNYGPNSYGQNNDNHNNYSQSNTNQYYYYSQEDPNLKAYHYNREAGRNYGPKKNGDALAKVSFIFGICSLILFLMIIDIPFAIVAIVVGIVFLKKYDATGHKIMAYIGIITAVLAIVLTITSYCRMFSNEALVKSFESEDQILFDEDESDFIDQFENNYEDNDIFNYGSDNTL